MANDDPTRSSIPGNTNFTYTPFQPGQRETIRLLTILPKPQIDTDNTSPLYCSISHYSIHVNNLQPGIPQEALVSRFPTVNFHAQVEKRPTELLVTPHALGLVEDAKAGIIPKRTDGSPWILPDRKKTKENPLNPVIVEGISSLVSHLEDTGGGFKLVVNELEPGSRLRRGLRKIFGSRSARRLQALGPKPLRRKPIAPKFSWGNYVALSYEWGYGPDDQKIFIKDCSSPHTGPASEFRPFYIRRNLHAALRRLRLMPQFIDGCRLWADAICINQKSRIEQEAQLKIMSLIYQRAGNVLVWLGEGDSDLYDAINLVQEIGCFYRLEYQEAYDDVNPHTASVHRESAALVFKAAMGAYINWARTAHMPPITYEEANLLNEFFSLAYWRRLWMIQELVMGTPDMALVLGDRVTEWRYVRDTAFVLAAIGDVFGQALIEVPRANCIDVSNTVVHIAKIAQLGINCHRPYIPRAVDLDNQTHLESGPVAGPQRGDALWQVFRLMAYAKCTMQKDRVFGILSLPCLPNLAVEHDSNNSTVEIYIQFVAGCANASIRHPLQFLCLVDGATDYLVEYKTEADGTKTEVSRERLPSWVPNLSSDRETGIIEGAFRAGDKWDQYQIMGWEPEDAGPEVSLGRDRILHVRGFVVDIVDGLGGVRPLIMLGQRYPDSLGPQPQHELIQPKRSPPWPLDDVTPQAAIYGCLIAGADENGTKVRHKSENPILLGSFINSEPWDDLARYFIDVNAGLLIGGFPLSSYLNNWNNIFTESIPMDPKTRAEKHTMLTRTRGKRLMVTELGFLGLVPNSVAVGDVVIILKGHGRPVIASKVMENGKLVGYKMKGEAYIKGMMSGEMMEDEYRKEMEDLVFI